MDSVSLREKSGLEKKRREVICRRDHRKNGCFSVQKSLDRIWKFPPFSSSPYAFWHHLSQDVLEEIIFEDNLDEKVSERFGKPPKVHSCPGGGSREKHTHNTRHTLGKPKPPIHYPNSQDEIKETKKNFLLPGGLWQLYDERQTLEGRKSNGHCKSCRDRLNSTCYSLRQSRRRKNCCSAPSILPQLLQGDSNWIAILLL